MGRKEKKKVYIFVICVILLTVLVSVVLGNYFFEDKNGITLWITLLEIVGVLMTIIVAVVQLNESKEISRASFIVELNSNFVSN